MKSNLLIIFCFLFLPLCAQSIRPEFKSQGWSDNPVFTGWYADPEGIIYGDEFWIFPTYSDDYSDPAVPPVLSPLQRKLQKNTINPQYLKQTFLDAFSSKDLVNWEKHSSVLDVKDIKWAAYSIWAPSVIQANNKYYLFFGANDIQNNDQMGGIGVAVADKPEGPYKDAIGDKPTGPFRRVGKILQQNTEVATGAGHHSVIRIPGTDEYYIVYHRRPLNTNNGNHREVCIDRMFFNADGTIKPVEITFKGVEARKLDVVPAQTKITAIKVGSRIDVSINDNLFTQYIFSEDEKYPFFFPVNGPSGFSVTSMRNSLYPHHSSLFFGCDRVNGGNYWQEGLERGQIRTLRAEIKESGGDKVVIENECIKKGDTLNLRYRVLVHSGDTKAAGIEEAFKRYVTSDK